MVTVGFFVFSPKPTRRVLKNFLILLFVQDIRRLGFLKVIYFFLVNFDDMTCTSIHLKEYHADFGPWTLDLGPPIDTYIRCSQKSLFLFHGLRRRLYSILYSCTLFVHT